MTSKSPNTTAKRQAKLPPVHPGEILKETLEDLGLSMNRLAQEIHVPANRISGIVAGQRSISGETALRLGRYFGTTAAYWINSEVSASLRNGAVRFANRSGSGSVSHVFREQGIHIVADTVAEVVADDAYSIQPGD